MDRADKKELKKLRAKVVTMQREFDIANRRPKGPLKPTGFQIRTFFAQFSTFFR